MNQKYLWNLFNVNADVNLMVDNVIQNKNGIMIRVNVNVEKPNKTSVIRRRLYLKS